MYFTALTNMHLYNIYFTFFHIAKLLIQKASAFIFRKERRKKNPFRFDYLDFPYESIKDI